jgi:ABC-type nitrate/sulfonate/bicarbonate transport system substrate-binding protein
MKLDSLSASLNSRSSMPTVRRSVLLVAAWMLFICRAIPPHDRAAAQERKKIVVAYVAASEQMIVPTVAQEAGVFRKHGLDAQVVLVSGSPRNVQSLIAGNFDYTMAGVTPLVRARLSGADPAILAAIANYSTQKIVVAAQAKIHKVEELRGRIVGVTQYGSEGDTFLRIALRSAGLRPDVDVTIFQTGGGANTVQALAAGKIHAGATGGANALQAKRFGAYEIASGTEMKVLAPAGTLATTRRHIARDRQEVISFMRAFVEAIHFFKTNREASIRIMQRFMAGLPREIIEPLYDETKETLPMLPLPMKEAIQAVLDRETDAKARALQPADVADLSFLQEIDKSGFLKELYKSRAP